MLSFVVVENNEHFADMGVSCLSTVLICIIKLTCPSGVDAQLLINMITIGKKNLIFLILIDSMLNIMMIQGRSRLSP